VRASSLLRLCVAAAALVLALPHAARAQAPPTPTSDPVTVYSEVLETGPLATVTVELADSSDGWLRAVIRATEREPLPEGAAVTAVLRSGGQRARLRLTRDDRGEWRAGVRTQSADEGRLSLLVTSPGADRHPIGVPGRSLRPVPLRIDAAPITVPATRPDAPLWVVDSVGQGVLARIRGGVYVADPAGLGFAATLELTEEVGEDTEILVEWNPAGLPSSRLPVHRVGPVKWEIDELPVPQGSCDLVVRIRRGREVIGRLGSDEEPVRFTLDLDGALDPGDVRGPGPLAGEQIEGFPVIFREDVATGPIETWRIGALPAGRGVQVLAHVVMRQLAASLPPHVVVMEVNGELDTWRTVKLTQSPDPQVWTGVVELPHRGWGYATVQIQSDEGPLQTLGTRLRAARPVELTPLAGGIHLPATSVDAPRIVLTVPGEGLIERAEIGVFMADLDGLGVRFRLDLARDLPEGAVLELEWNGTAAPWVPESLHQIGPRTWEGVARPVNPGTTYFRARAVRGTRLLGRVGNPARLPRFTVTLLPE